jgi:hypothetical protein
MGPLAIELSDTGLCAARRGEDGLLALDGAESASPGFARLGGGTIVTGVAAERGAALHRRDVIDRFWDTLDTEPADPKRPRSPNRAEVACAHLGHVLEGVHRPGEDVVIAVPPVYDRRQLGLLVAVAEELDAPLRGLVASPIIVDSESESAQTIVVVELGLHRCILSVVEAGERVCLRRTRVTPDVGRQTFRRQWLAAIGGELLRATRFDPLHDAHSEQALRDRLPEILDGLHRDGSAAVELPVGSLAHRVTVTDDLVARAGQALIFELCTGIEAVAGPDRIDAILLAHGAARVPGLARILRQRMPAPVHELVAGAAAIGLAKLWPERFDHPGDAGVAYHTWRRS